MIYLDYQATTPLAPEAFEAMVPLLRDHFGNPHSTHRAGRQAAAQVELARDRIGAAMGLPPGQIIFTSGATEALNIAISGMAQGAPPGRRRIVTLATEHAAVRDTVLALEGRGFEPVLLPVRRDGLVDLDIARLAITPDTALVTAMLVNNEIGVIQPVDALCHLARAAGARFLCDAVQGFGRAALPQEADAVAISAHKIHGPKGVGALWLRNGLTLPPLLHGGGQEGGLRSGTLSPALCAGFGVAADLMQRRREADAHHVEELWQKALKLFEGWAVNGSLEQRYRGNVSLRRDGVDGARLLSDCRDIAFSLGSACASGSGRPSHVLQAIGLSDKEARGSVRIGFGRYTSVGELEDAAGAITQAAERQLHVANGAHET
ncbi:MAG: cysteine desulfurase family protein [Sphingobium sp.]|uniref:cysteine desulfurase family protein n=1 Tax=Sphingobium sp. TaxID=1912891 RepID=UPI0029A315D2|nr:cysteine desulfurase family protein [Sphingobium sp.]MDX3908555.1 cysteine desulfurase family protein [Sphingobium sp.]